MPEQPEEQETHRGLEHNESWVRSLMGALTKRAPGAAERVAKKPLSDRLGWLKGKSRGDDKRAAERAGVTPRTWKNWLTGRSKPSKKSLEQLARAERDALVPPKRRADLAASTKQVGMRGRDTRVQGGAYLSGTIQVSQDSRPRTIQFGRHLPAGFMDEVAAAYVEGGDAAALEKLHDGLATHYFGTSNFTIHDVEELEFDRLEDPMGDVGDREGRYISDVESPKPGDILED